MAGLIDGSTLDLVDGASLDLPDDNTQKPPQEVQGILSSAQQGLHDFGDSLGHFLPGAAGRAVLSVTPNAPVGMTAMQGLAHGGPNGSMDLSNLPAAGANMLVGAGIPMVAGRAAGAAAGGLIGGGIGAIAAPFAGPETIPIGAGLGSEVGGIVGPGVAGGIQGYEDARLAHLQARGANPDTDSQTWPEWFNAVMHGGIGAGGAMLGMGKLGISGAAQKVAGSVGRVAAENAGQSVAGDLVDGKAPDWNNAAAAGLAGGISAPGIHVANGAMGLPGKATGFVKDATSGVDATPRTADDAKLAQRMANQASGSNDAGIQLDMREPGQAGGIKSALSNVHTEIQVDTARQASRLKSAANAQFRDATGADENGNPPDQSDIDAASDQRDAQLDALKVFTMKATQGNKRMVTDQDIAALKSAFPDNTDNTDELVSLANQHNRLRTFSDNPQGTYGGISQYTRWMDPFDHASSGFQKAIALTKVAGLGGVPLAGTAVNNAAKAFDRATGQYNPPFTFMQNGLKWAAAHPDEMAGKPDGTPPATPADPAPAGSPMPDVLVPGPGGRAAPGKLTGKSMVDTLGNVHREVQSGGKTFFMPEKSLIRPQDADPAAPQAPQAPDQGELFPQGDRLPAQGDLFPGSAPAPEVPQAAPAPENPAVKPPPKPKRTPGAAKATAPGEPLQPITKVGETGPDGQPAAPAETATKPKRAPRAARTAPRAARTAPAADATAPVAAAPADGTSTAKTIGRFFKGGDAQALPYVKSFRDVMMGRPATMPGGSEMDRIVGNSGARKAALGEAAHYAMNELKVAMANDPAVSQRDATDLMHFLVQMNHEGVTVPERQALYEKMAAAYPNDPADSDPHVDHAMAIASGLVEAGSVKLKDKSEGGGPGPDGGPPRAPLTPEEQAKRDAREAAISKNVLAKKEREAAAAAGSKEVPPEVRQAAKAKEALVRQAEPAPKEPEAEKADPAVPPDVIADGKEPVPDPVKALENQKDAAKAQKAADAAAQRAKTAADRKQADADAKAAAQDMKAAKKATQVDARGRVGTGKRSLGDALGARRNAIRNAEARLGDVPRVDELQEHLLASGDPAERVRGLMLRDASDRVTYLDMVDAYRDQFNVPPERAATEVSGALSRLKADGVFTKLTGGDAMKDGRVLRHPDGRAIKDVVCQPSAKHPFIANDLQTAKAERLTHSMTDISRAKPEASADQAMPGVDTSDPKVRVDRSVAFCNWLRAHGMGLHRDLLNEIQAASAKPSDTLTRALRETSKGEESDSALNALAQLGVQLERQEGNSFFQNWKVIANGRAFARNASASSQAGDLMKALVRNSVREPPTEEGLMGLWRSWGNIFGEDKANIVDRRQFLVDNLPHILEVTAKGFMSDSLGQKARDLMHAEGPFQGYAAARDVREMVDFALGREGGAKYRGKPVQEQAGMFSDHALMQDVAKNWHTDALDTSDSNNNGFQLTSQLLGDPKVAMATGMMKRPGDPEDPEQRPVADVYVGPAREAASKIPAFARALADPDLKKTNKWIRKICKSPISTYLYDASAGTQSASIFSALHDGEKWRKYITSDDLKARLGDITPLDGGGKSFMDGKNRFQAVRSADGTFTLQKFMKGKSVADPANPGQKKATPDKWADMSKGFTDADGALHHAALKGLATETGSQIRAAVSSNYPEVVKMMAFYRLLGDHLKARGDTGAYIPTPDGQMTRYAFSETPDYGEREVTYQTAAGEPRTIRANFRNGVTGKMVGRGLCANATHAHDAYVMRSLALDGNPKVLNPIHDAYGLAPKEAAKQRAFVVGKMLGINRATYTVDGVEHPDFFQALLHANGIDPDNLPQELSEMQIPQRTDLPAQRPEDLQTAVS